MLAGKLYILFAILAAVFGGMAASSYLRNARRLTPAARVRARISAVFLIVAAYLYFSGS